MVLKISGAIKPGVPILLCILFSWKSALEKLTKQQSVIQSGNLLNILSNLISLWNTPLLCIWCNPNNNLYSNSATTFSLVYNNYGSINFYSLPAYWSYTIYK